MFKWDASVQSKVSEAECLSYTQPAQAVLQLMKERNTYLQKTKHWPLLAALLG